MNNAGRHFIAEDYGILFVCVCQTIEKKMNLLFFSYFMGMHINYKKLYFGINKQNQILEYL